MKPKTKSQAERAEEQKAALPYWPSPEYIKKCLSQIKKLGVKGTKTELTSLILQAYWQKREEILTK